MDNIEKLEAMIQKLKDLQAAVKDALDEKEIGLRIRKTIKELSTPARLH